MTLHIEILTLFPEMFPGILGSSMLRRAVEANKLQVSVRHIRQYATDKHQVCDDTPYGGGPGMVMKCEPIAAAFEAAAAEHPDTSAMRIFLTPDGIPLTQELVRHFAAQPGLTLLCGHYEGVDERVRTQFIDIEVSIGDYVLTCGELPALVLIDAVSRMIPGVLGNDDSAQEDSFAAGPVLDYPHYTRPPEFRGECVPEILLSGHHGRIAQWRRLQALLRTRARRPDLWAVLEPTLAKSDRKILSQWEESQAQHGSVVAGSE